LLIQAAVYAVVVNDQYAYRPLGKHRIAGLQAVSQSAEAGLA